MPTDLMRVSAPPATPHSNGRNANIVAIALTAALITLQLIGLAVLERSHAHAMHVSFPREPAACTEGAPAVVSQIPYD
ncbi:hypothetical protein A5906_03965 [Bradyrhizobium sacchari]|uniref:Uncharacterized protein n=1 Tax=Bradyrhizobium sacchari TaxID=1399419 RepID=A0A560KMQ5_9BRAD|nr:hypothetical protein [Bradyrhizobium sacchari]OPY96420.1 hypothetical protein A5906_03965 [Bradyrhizobium sacchari]TWB67175.1 hypothetical protein FBZ94_101857 [Bradyrhizobium sacchari]TWB84412.1 hypothetical protein FBZ95_101857 [Bradyrhizobium sacchari]